MNNKNYGLTEAEVEASRVKHGKNALEKEKTRSFFRKFISNLSDPIIKVLLIAVAIEVIVTFRDCNWFEVGGIVVAILIASTVSTVSEYGSEQAFAKMQEANEKSTSTVIREGKALTVPSEDLVVGDLMLLHPGEMISADANIVEGSLGVDQSALNGESVEVHKYPSGDSGNSLSSPSALHRGSMVISGNAKAVVTGVGKTTYYGMVAKDVQSETRESPLKLRLGKLASQISKLGYIMAAIVGLTYLFFAVVVDNGYDIDKILVYLKDFSNTASLFSHVLTLMITVIVVAVPEGLPMMITVVLSANMKKMLNDSIMVKKLVGIETAGSMNILFTDKTGTLTTGKTSLDRIIAFGKEYVSSQALRSAGDIFRILSISARYSNPEGDPGNSTDKAIRYFFETSLMHEAKVVSREEFSSDKKYSSLTLEDGSVIYKGAPEIIISLCNYEIGKNKERRAINKNALIKEYTSCAKRGERVIAFAISESGETSFVAFAVLKDKLRDDAKEAVRQMRSAGVKVVMITGDGKETAAAIAKECGIVDRPSDVILTHDELELLGDNELKAIIPKLKVVARALPKDKLRLVRLSQELDMVVGMTGDGINDAPSLKLADVGFAMGSGTDIAKGAADIVILDDSFSALKKTVLYGRTIFKSIRKFISFQLMMNIIACGISLVGQFIGVETPITIIQMLWVNIIMDTLGGLAFAGEPPLEYYMLEQPKRRDEKILSGDMLHQIAATGAYSLLVCILFLKLESVSALFRSSASDKVFLTAFYALFIFMGIFNSFNARSERMSILSNIGKNKAFLLIMTFVVAVQLCMIFFGGELFRSVPLTFREILNVVLIASTVIPFDCIRRIFKKLSR